MPNSSVTAEAEAAMCSTSVKSCVKSCSSNQEVFLPDDVLLQIFELLSCKELGRAGQVCWQWKHLAYSEYIWKKRFIKDYSLKNDVKLIQGATSWKEEYERLSDRVPSQELDRIEEHTDEVLHVAFSHNGMMFCTCSKDAFVRVYNADWPFETVFSSHLGGPNSLFQWKYTQLSQFSPCDTQLLVSGRCAGSHQGGEIVIYNIFAGQFTIQARVRIVPYDVMGTWLNDTHILSARAHIISSTFQSLCEVVLNKSGQEVEDLYQSTVNRSFLFRCNNLATVSYLLVSDLTKPMKQVVRSFVSVEEMSNCLHPIHVKNLNRTPTDANKSVSPKCEETVCEACNQSMFTSQHNVKRMKWSPAPTLRPTHGCFSFCSASRSSEMDSDHEAALPKPPHEGSTLLKSCGFITTDSDSVIGDGEGRRASLGVRKKERDEMVLEERLKATETGKVCSQCGKPLYSKQTRPIGISDIDSSSAPTSTDEDLLGINVPERYKLLICFTGDLVCIPHQIGIKVLHQEECSKVADTELRNLLSGADRPEMRADSFDHVLELRGQCVGMTLSPCNRYLYVNVREWLGGWQEELLVNNHNPLPPPISTKIKMVVFDLISMKQIATMLGHSAESDVFFLHLSTNDLYVASGSEDSCGYIWDRHYQARVASLAHEKVVNCVAVNPRDPSMAVSVSDDRTIKIWRSRAFHRLLNGARAKARNKLRFASCHHHA